MRIPAVVTVDKNNSYLVHVIGDSTFEGPTYEHAVAKAQGVLAHFGKLGEITTRFPNKAGDHADTDEILTKELTDSGIEVITMPEILRDSNGEVKTVIRGELHGWSFKRAWYYWIAEGPGLPPTYADPLHTLCGSEVRVGGHCVPQRPIDMYHGMGVPVYHVDTQRGLLELARAIKRCVQEAK